MMIPEGVVGMLRLYLLIVFQEYLRSCGAIDDSVTGRTDVDW